MEAGTTAVHPVAAEVDVPEAQASTKASRPAHRVRATLPVTRGLTRTLGAVLLVGGISTLAGLVIGHGPAAWAAFSLAVCGAAVAVALVRAIVLLTPPALRAASARPVRVAVVGAAGTAADLRAELHRAELDCVELVGAIAPNRAGSGAHDLELGGLPDVGQIVERHGIDLLLIGPGVPRMDVLDAVLRRCEGQEVRVCDLAVFAEDVFGCVAILEADAGWLQCVLHPRYRRRRSKRIFDVIVAAFLAVLCLPLLGALALLVRRDGGPALFRQRRVGRDGRPFVISKLRTMRWQPTGESACWAEDGDPRITRLGRVLRRTHLDELPQLINVLRGEMTLVGPRPEQPEIAARLDAALPLWRGRHRHAPGLTGWAQVRCGYGGSDDGAAMKLAHDLYYLRRASLALDVAILAQTAFMFVTGRSADVPTAPYVVRRIPEGAPPVEDRPHDPPPHVGVMPVRVIVTGGAGFIGAQLVDELVTAGHEVVAVDNLSAGRVERLERALASGARLEIADVTDAARMQRLFTAARPQVVFHLAAPSELSHGVDDPLTDASASIVGTLAVLEAARRCSARRFVLASSGAIYGDAGEIPTSEAAAATPLSPSGAAKAAAEHYTALYGRLHGISTMTLRLASVYGPGQRDGGVIPRLCRARLDGSPAPVFGDGAQTRDFVHVRDVVSAFVAAGHSATTGALNIGTGIETSVLDLVRMLGVQAEFRAARAGEIRRSCVDASSAERQLGWVPETSLAAGLAEMRAHEDAMRGKTLTREPQVQSALPIDEAYAGAGSPPPRARSLFSRWPRAQRRTVARSASTGPPTAV